jgi:hypothetical protein
MSRAACIALAERLGLAVDDVLEWWAERAAVREFEGGQPRAAAELAAFDDARLHFDTTAFTGRERKGPIAAGRSDVARDVAGDATRKR